MANYSYDGWPSPALAPSVRPSVNKTPGQTPLTGVLILWPFQQVRQLANIDRDTPRLIARQAAHYPVSAGLILEINVGECLTMRVADAEAFGGFVYLPGCGEAAGMICHCGQSIVAIPHSRCNDTGSPSLAHRSVDQGFRQQCPLVCCTSRNAAWDSGVDLGLWHGQKACSSRRVWRCRNASRFRWFVFATDPDHACGKLSRIRLPMLCYAEAVAFRFAQGFSALLTEIPAADMPARQTMFGHRQHRR
jgi:hypothetical protein